jgi:hypothetical protein
LFVAQVFKVFVLVRNLHIQIFDTSVCSAPDYPFGAIAVKLNFVFETGKYYVSRVLAVNGKAPPCDCD